MIAAGIVCFALPVDTTLTTLAYVIGAIVLVIGVVEIAMFFTTVGLFGGGAFLADGIITTILGIIMLQTKTSSQVSCPSFSQCGLFTKAFRNCRWRLPRADSDCRTGGYF